MQSPELHVDLQTDWRAVLAVGAWLGVVVNALWHSELPVVLLVAFTAAVLIIGLPVAWSQGFSWPRRNAQSLRLLPTGSGWLVEEGGHQAIDLHASSRVFPGGAALFLARTTGRLDWVLLLASRSNATTLRRLAAQVRLAPRQPAASGVMARLRTLYNPGHDGSQNNLNWLTVPAGKARPLAQSSNRAKSGTHLRELSPDACVIRGAQAGLGTQVASPDGH